MKQAIVIGGSMAGLLTARVLTDHFEQVTVVERDRLADTPDPRRGVPQAHHVHVLLGRGLAICEQLFPGFQEDLIAAGAAPADVASDYAWLTRAGWGIRFPSSLITFPCSRVLLEWLVRRRLAANPQVRLLDGAGVEGLTGEGSCITGVRLGGETLTADLVVDASGRGSHAPQWLAELGWPTPDETTIDAHMGYGTRIFRRPPSWQADWKAVIVWWAPPEGTRAAALLPMEGDRWLVTLGGGDRDYPPTDEAGWLDFAASLPTPLIWEAVREAEPLTPIRSSRSTANRLRHFERLPRRPERFVALGDAVCAFNPVYGQGMTTAALGALTLNRCLARLPLDGLAGPFQRRLAKTNAEPWMLATSEDYRFAHVEGPPPTRQVRLMQRYVDRVLAASTSDPKVRLVQLETFNMLRSANALFTPPVMVRTLIAQRSAALGRVSEVAA
jgi:2-polyprenyl-6-methoxyphenol hydroxylase-like FAD-dependent oxidoreductase